MYNLLQNNTGSGIFDAMKKDIDLQNLMQTSPATNLSTIQMARLNPLFTQANIEKTKTETGLMPKQTDIKLIDVLNKNFANRISAYKLPYEIFNYTYRNLPEAAKAQYALQHPVEFAQMQKDVIAQASSAGRPGYVSPALSITGAGSPYGSQIQSIVDKYVPSSGGQQVTPQPQQSNSPLMGGGSPQINQPTIAGTSGSVVLIPSYAGNVIPPENTPDIQNAAQNIKDVNTDVKLKSTLTSSQLQKLPYWRNLESTASVLENLADGASKYAGNPIGRAANWGLSTVGKESKDYDNYKAFMSNAPQFASQLRQSYGDSVQPSQRDEFLKLVEPQAFGESPKLFIQRLKMAMNIIRNEGLTASMPLHQLVSPSTQQQQSQNIVSGAQQSMIQQPRIKMISPDGKNVLMAKKDVQQAMKNGFKVRQ